MTQTAPTASQAADRIVADDRSESEDCQRLTPGCCIDHSAEWKRNRAADSPCETW